MLSEQRVNRRRRTLIEYVTHFDIGRVLKCFECNMCRWMRGPHSQAFQFVGFGSRRIEQIVECAVGRFTVDYEELRRPRKIANWCETGQRVVVQLPEMGIDDELRCIDQQRAAIRSCSRRGLRSNRTARPRTVLNNHREALRTTDLVGQQSRQDIRPSADSGGKR